MSFSRQSFQLLVLEVLGAHPCLRESRAYLSAFGPRPSPVATSTSAHDTALSLRTDLGTSSQQHVALVKMQGPFTPRQLGCTAEGLAYLKRLGLISVIVVDKEAWTQSTSRFASDGSPILPGESAGENEFRTTWQQRSSATVPTDLVQEEGMRKRMLTSTYRLAQVLSENGLDAQPFHAFMRVDGPAAQASHNALQGAAPWAQPIPTNPSALLDSRPSNPPPQPSPLVADDGLAALRHALQRGTIPILPPLALVPTATTLQTVPISSNDLLPNLAREMSLAGTQSDKLDMTPVRLMMINRYGGIPSHARRGFPHLSINLSTEYDSIQSSFVWRPSHPTSLTELQLSYQCLSVMPPSSSAIVVSHRSPRSLIANLITNKAAHSPSLPDQLQKHDPHTPTILRRGLALQVCTRMEQVDWDRVQEVLQASFQRTLNRPAYLARLAHTLDFVLVIGDYQGLAIVTREWAPGEDRRTIPPIAYLDKFALLPSLQGSDAVDFLWGALRDEVHGAELLHTLNTYGGRNGQGQGRDLVWKSRASNPVNRWYAERSNGFLKIDTRSSEAKALDTEPRKDWCMYWCDSEQRLAEMAGEVRLSAQMSTQAIQDMARADALGARATAASAAAAQAQAHRRSTNPSMMIPPRSPLGLEMRPMHT